MGRQIKAPKGLRTWSLDKLPSNHLGTGGMLNFPTKFRIWGKLAKAIEGNQG